MLYRQPGLDQTEKLLAEWLLRSRGPHCSWWRWYYQRSVAPELEPVSAEQLSHHQIVLVQTVSPLVESETNQPV